MKKFSKTIIFILVISLSLVTFNIKTNAEEDIFASYRQGSGYVAIGDSMTRGYGANANWKDEIYLSDTTASKNCRIVNGAFPVLVADELGLSYTNDITDTTAQYWPLCHSATSISYFLDLFGIDDGFCDTEYIYSGSSISNRYKTDLTYFSDPTSYAYGGKQKTNTTGSVISCKKLIEDATLISIWVGGADLAVRQKDLYLEKIDFSDINSVNEGLEKFITETYASLARYKEQYRLLIDYVTKANSDCTIVLVGMLNPVQDVTLFEGSSISLGTILNPVFDILNKFTREIAKEYNCIFIDTSTVETPITEHGYSLKEVIENDELSKLYTHPSPVGYQQIARMIVDALKEKEIEKNKTNIKIDVGRFKTVDYVLVNGIKTTNYSFENNTVTINNESKLVKTVTIATIESKTKLAVTNYGTTYTNDGYIVKKINTTNSVIGGISTVVTKCVSSIKSVVKKLFK